MEIVVLVVVAVAAVAASFYCSCKSLARVLRFTVEQVTSLWDLSVTGEGGGGGGGVGL